MTHEVIRHTTPVGRHPKRWLMLRNNTLTRLNSEKRIEIQSLKRRANLRHRDLTDTLPKTGQDNPELVTSDKPKRNKKGRA